MLFQKVTNKIRNIVRVYLFNDPLAKWYKDRGDKTLRLDYPLNQASVVLDVGGYVGDYADEIYKKFGCHIYLFEPVPRFYDECVKRFSNNPAIVCLNYGLAAQPGWFEMSLKENESSFKKVIDGCVRQKAEVRSVTEVVAKLGIEKIDLIKINIEGGEFDLLPAIIDSGLVKRIKYIQVQFHNFDSSATEARSHIRSLLEKTHREMWNYEFVWESWEML